MRRAAHPEEPQQPRHSQARRAQAVRSAVSVHEGFDGTTRAGRERGLELWGGWAVLGEIDFTTTLGATMKETVSNGEDVFSYLLIEMSSDPSQQYAEQLAKCLGVLLSPSRIRGLL